MGANRLGTLIIVPWIGVASLWVACGGGTDAGPGGPDATSADGESPSDPGPRPDPKPEDIPGPDPLSGEDSLDVPAGADAPAEADVPDVPGDPGAPDIPDVPPDPKCDALAPGTVSGFDVDGTPRTFLLHLPAGVEDGGPWPVVFNWHGFGDTATNMAWLLSGQVDNASWPFILVTPEDTNLQPPSGMDWDILTVNEPNQEARLFDEVLKCLDQRWGVDRDRVHAVGFSAGAIMADLLGVLRGDQVASIATYSGVYFSNPPNVEALGMLSSFVSWPAMATGNRYAQLLVHGGPNDHYNLYVASLQFDESGKRDATWLNELGHDVVHCDHGGGHTVPSAFNDGGGRLVQFFQAHPRGQGASPWRASGLPAGYPGYCVLEVAITGPETLDLVPGCNPFASSDECVLPYPSHWFEVPDPASPTGVRVHYPEDAIPVPEWAPPFDMNPTNLADGVSPAGPILVHFGADVHPDYLTDIHHLADSLAPGSPIALFDFETGGRVVFLSEMDANRKDEFPGRYALIIRPMAAMTMGHRHVIALTRDLADADGHPLPSPRAFEVLRDQILTTNPEIEAVRGHYEDLFAFLADHGYPRDRLLLAWDFAVASRDFLLGSVLSMREATLAEVTGRGLGYTITKNVEDPNEFLARLVEGDFEVPTYLRDDNTFEYDEDHHPVRQFPNRTFPFTMIIPKKAKTRGGPLPLLVFGHGIFGSGRSYLAGWGSSITQPLAEENGIVMIATDWIGLSSKDKDLIIQEVLPDLNRLAIVTDRLQQSLINNLTLTELALGDLGRDPAVMVGEGELLDPARVYYYGVSLGGIQGTSFVAISNRITRGVLAVPGSVWLNMIPRSTVFIPIKIVMDPMYPDPLAQQMAIAFFQTWFDHSDPLNLTHLLFEDPPPGAPAERTVVFQEAIGDCQVPNMATEMLARSRGVKVMTPSVTGVFGLKPITSPATESVLVQYRLDNWDDPAPPEENVPPSADNGVHSEMVFLPHVLEQAAHFLETGEVVQYCDDACDPD